MIKSYQLLLFILISTSFFMVSCSKSEDPRVNILLGKWKTSYGDTITFLRKNGKNMINYDLPALSNIESEFRYRNNKLGIKDSFSGTGNFREFQTFTWTQTGESFTIQGVEWFLFISSTTVYYTFTKL